jgi:hypothetical protein
MELEELYKIEPEYNQIPGGVRLNEKNIFSLQRTEPFLQKINKEINIIHNVLTEFDCIQIIKYFESQGKYAPVSVQGMTETGIYNNTKGSNRITGFGPKLAQQLYVKIKDQVEKYVTFNEKSSTDWWQYSDGSYEGHKEWKLVGLSPMLRFMKYEPGGKHYAHYDAGFLYPGGTYRTLKSFVLYLTTNDTGATRFINDGQENIPVHLRNHNDWDKDTNVEDVYFKTLPKRGNMLIFDHKLCHDVEPFLGNELERIIIRGDILFEKI